MPKLFNVAGFVSSLICYFTVLSLLCSSFVRFLLVPHICESIFSLFTRQSHSSFWAHLHLPLCEKPFLIIGREEESCSVPPDPWSSLVKTLWTLLCCYKLFCHLPHYGIFKSCSPLYLHIIGEQCTLLTGNISQETQNCLREAGLYSMVFYRMSLGSNVSSAAYKL